MGRRRGGASLENFILLALSKTKKAFSHKNIFGFSRTVKSFVDLLCKNVLIMMGADGPFLVPANTTKLIRAYTNSI